jgi:hypothetical protein
VDFELVCGRCGSSLALSVGEEHDTLVMDLVHRFAQAHESCGFIAPHNTSNEVSHRKSDTQE